MFRIESLLVLFEPTRLAYFHAWNPNSLSLQYSRMAKYFWIKHNKMKQFGIETFPSVKE